MFCCNFCYVNNKSTFNWIKSHYQVIAYVCGGLLIFIGVLMATGTLGKLLSWLS